MGYVSHRANESEEDYLETILALEEKNGQVRSIDIANEMNFSKPSVSIAMKKLKEKELVIIDEKGNIILTKKGREHAEDTLDRHRVLTKCLIKLGVSDDIAQEDACKIEHDLSPETYQAIKNHIKGTIDLND